MLGGRSIQLVRVFGIRIGVDPSWFFVLFLIIWSLSGAYRRAFPDETVAFVLATVSALLFFVSVIMHELGHALVAVRNGIGIAGIDLWLFGGVAKMTRDTDSPGLEFRVAVAGPLVTLAVVIVCAVSVTLVYGPEELRRALLFDAAAPGAAVLGYLALINGVLLVFNLIPGFPLDGGRIVRALAWKVTGNRTKGTRVAAALGRAFAYVLVGWGIFRLVFEGDLVGGLWSVFIGIFLAQAARAAVFQSSVTEHIEGLSVADVMDAEPVAIPADATLEAALDRFFLRYGWSWFPVVDSSERFLGVLREEHVQTVPEAERTFRTAREVMSDDVDGAYRVSADEPLESLLGSEGLRRLGALMAVDGDGVLRGVVTVDRVRRALRPAAPAV